MKIETLFWKNGAVWILDQRKLPLETQYMECRSCEEVAFAIEQLVVRGAPAIGIAAAFGVALASRDGHQAAEASLSRLSCTRPTAVNLFWVLQRMKKLIDTTEDRSLFPCLLLEAEKMLEQDVEVNRRLGGYGQTLLPDNPVVITHCNAGALATGGYGTALGVIRAAAEKGKYPVVYACETRPVLQGSRLTAWELFMDNIDVTVITDNMAGSLMLEEHIDAVIVGADRIAMNGDTANKIGTYSLAVLARHHNIPFYIAAPISTIDRNIQTGSEIEIEQRDPEEVRCFRSERVVAEGISIWNPAFDVTEAELINCIITECGLVFPEYPENIAKLFR